MRIRLGVDGHDASNACLIESLTIQQDSREAISTVEFTIFQTYGIARYDVARYNQAAFIYEWTVEPWSEIVLWDDDTNKLLFAGFVMTVEHSLDGPHLRRNVSASDWGILLERAIVSHEWPDGTLDSTVVADVLAVVPEITPGTIVTQVTNMGALEAKDARVRDVLDQVCELSGGEWHVSYDGKLNYYRIGSIVPPFDLSDQPDWVNSVGFELDTYRQEFAEAANRVLVLGALEGSGSEINYLAQDIASQQQFGVLSITLVDRNLTDATTAQLWAQTEVARRAWPSATVNATVYVEGLGRGQTVTIEANRYGVIGDFVLRSLTVVLIAPDGAGGHVLKYSGSFGMREPDLTYAIRRMQRRATERTQSPAATIPPGSISADDLVSGIAPVYIVSGKPTDWTKYPQDAVFLNTSDDKLYRRIPGNNWTAVVNTSEIEGQIQTTQLAPGSVTSTVLADGAVITAKIPGGAITAPQLGPGAITIPAIAPGAVTAVAIAGGSVTANAIAANAVTAQAIAANAVTANAIAANAITATAISAGAITATQLAAGAVTANAIAANAIYSEAIQSNAITAIKLAANSVVAGKIAALAVVSGTIAADAVTAGTIAAGAVRAGALAADSVTAGTVAAGAIRAQDAAFAVAAIQDADIQNLNGTKITAQTIDSTKLSAVEIAVGYGSNKPGRFGVYSPSGLVGLIGDLGAAGLPGNTYFGIWAKLGSFGGTGYSDAPIYTDNSGNLFIRNAQFKLTQVVGGRSQSVEILPNTFDTTYSSLGVKVVDGTNYTWLVGRGSATYNNSGQVLAACVMDPGDTNAGQVYCQKPGTTSAYCMMDGKTGRIRADGGFQVGGNTGANTAIQVTATSGQKVTLTWMGGILTSAVINP